VQEKVATTTAYGGERHREKDIERSRMNNVVCLCVQATCEKLKLLLFEVVRGW
jgi:hypothetical protein